MNPGALKHLGACLIAAASTACGVAGGAPRTVPATRPLTPITTFADSFVSVLHARYGTDTGWVSERFEATATGYRLIEDFQLTPAAYRTATVFFAPDLTVDSVRGIGRRGALVIDYAVSYVGRRASGWTSAGGADPSRRIAVDAVLPDSAVDAVAQVAILPTLPWAVGMKRTLLAFDPTVGGTQTQLLSVLDEEQVTVPAGTFDAYRAEVRQPDFVQIVWYTRSVPHRFVKAAGATGNWSWELVH